jgi:hypothetical protein
MTKDELVKITVQNTEGLKAVKEAVEKSEKDSKDRDEKHRKLLNDHLHEHAKLRFWLFTFLITTNITSFLSLISLIIYLLVEKPN